jgi:Mn-dependent DtxR family transcriptional regulator
MKERKIVIRHRTVISLLEEVTGLVKPRAEEVHTDLDRFFGCISKEEADELDQAIREQRQVDRCHGAFPAPRAWAEGHLNS